MVGTCVMEGWPCLRRFSLDVYPLAVFRISRLVECRGKVAFIWFSQHLLRPDPYFALLNVDDVL